MHWNGGLNAFVYFVSGFQENSMQSPPAFSLFVGHKTNSKSFIFFHSLIIEFLCIANYGSNSKKRYTLRLLSKYLGRSTPFIQIWYHCSMSWNIIPLYFFYLKPLYFGQKELVEVKFSDFCVVGWKFNKLLMSCLKLQVSFSLNLAPLFSVMRDNSFVLF